MRNRNFLTATTLLSSLLFTLPGIQAQAQETTNHPNYSHNIDSSAANSTKFFLIDNGVDPKTTDTLIKNLEQGIIWDSLKGTPPVSSYTNHNGTVYTYPDGSISLFSIYPEKTTDGKFVSPLAVSNCQVTSHSTHGTYWKNCIASWNYGLYSIRFTFDYENVRYSGSRITGYRDVQYHIIGGAITNTRFIRDAQNKIRLVADVRFFKNAGGGTFNFTLTTNGATATTS